MASTGDGLNGVIDKQPRRVITIVS